MRLPLHVRPQPDESLKSWFIRLAHAHGEKVQSLAYRIWGRYPNFVEGNDIDRGNNTFVIESISHASGLSPADIYGMTLAAYQDWLWIEIASKGAVRWIRPIKDKNRHIPRFGQQVCFQCLRDDAEPYLRRSWRLSLHCMCPRHGCLLNDRCPVCEAPFMPQRGDIGSFVPPTETIMITCWKCGFDFRHAIPSSAESKVVAVHQQELLDTLSRGWTQINGRPIRSTLYFEGLWMLWAFFDSTRWSRTLAVRHDFAVTDAIENRYGGIDPLPPQRRLALLTHAMHYLNNWPASLVEALKSHHLASHKLLHFAMGSTRLTPFWLWEPIFLSCDQTMYVPTDEEINLAITYVRRRDGSVRASEVCELLNFKTRSSRRVYRRCKVALENLGVRL